MELIEVAEHVIDLIDNIDYWVRLQVYYSAALSTVIAAIVAVAEWETIERIFKQKKNR